MIADEVAEAENEPGDDGEPADDGESESGSDLHTLKGGDAHHFLRFELCESDLTANESAAVRSELTQECGYAGLSLSCRILLHITSS